MTLIWASLVVFLFVYALYVLLNIHKRKRFPPSPTGFPILGHLHLLAGKNPHQDLQKLANKHGPIMYVRLGLVPTIIASSADAAEKVLKTYDHIFASRPHHEASQYLAYGQKNLIFAKYGVYWRNMRKLCTVHLLSNNKINSFQSMRKQEVELLIESLKKEAHDRVVVDLSAKITSLNANLTCLMVFGKKYMDEDLDKRGFKSVVQDVVHLAATPNLGDFFPFLGAIDLQGLTRKLKDLSKVFDEFLEKIIDEHVHSYDQKQTKDFVDTMMGIMQSGEAEFQFDRRHIKAILFDMLIAAMDTTASSTEWILTELLRHPQVMKKLQKELQEVVGLERMVEESDLENLKYLNMVVKEGLRLHPVVPLFYHESVEDCVVDGFHIQKGSRVMVNCYAAQRDPNAWPDPEKFLPERFVGSCIDFRGRDFQLVPFGSGRRSCPGMQLAVMVARLVVAQLVHCFEWELPNGMQPCDLDIDEKFGIVTCREKPLMAIPTYNLNK
ncbi:cytochrome P450 71AU50-like isoform X1 [Solanum stenotomum]|uniref:cytochrome P450 71AU50-like isoform X1 n=1 Tax=Solanum stenotomum TaxID=172797 RepID=UPI0020D0BA3A|nr:cytochrome P450 71AU50-like isoform X1 [Solanum stenotomum]